MSSQTKTPARVSGGHGRGRIRTFEGISHQIYSLTPLATWVHARLAFKVNLRPSSDVVRSISAQRRFSRSLARDLGGR